MVRIDKFLNDNTLLTRKEAQKAVISGQVTVNGAVCRASDQKINELADEILVAGEAVRSLRTTVLMLNKPAGYVTAASDKDSPVVFELLPELYRKTGFQPVGRLDKETEGLLLFTNDGALLHRLISPAHYVEKVYYAEHEGIVGAADIEAFQSGIMLRDGTECRPAVLQSIGDGKSRITISEGKYHQVRRMMASRGLHVNYLRREQEGSVSLGDLGTGKYRILSAEEYSTLI